MKKWLMIKRWVPGTIQNPQGKWIYVITYFSSRLGHYVNYTDDIEKGTTFSSIEQLVATLAEIIRGDPSFGYKLASGGQFYFIEVMQKTETRTFRQELPHEV